MPIKGPRLVNALRALLDTATDPEDPPELLLRAFKCFVFTPSFIRSRGLHARGIKFTFADVCGYGFSEYSRHVCIDPALHDDPFLEQARAMRDCINATVMVPCEALAARLGDSRSLSPGIAEEVITRLVEVEQQDPESISPIDKLVMRVLRWEEMKNIVTKLDADEGRCENGGYAIQDKWPVGEIGTGHRALKNFVMLDKDEGRGNWMLQDENNQFGETKKWGIDDEYFNLRLNGNAEESDGKENDRDNNREISEHRAREAETIHGISVDGDEREDLGCEETGVTGKGSGGDIDGYTQEGEEGRLNTDKDSGGDGVLEIEMNYIRRLANLCLLSARSNSFATNTNFRSTIFQHVQSLPDQTAKEKLMQSIHKLSLIARECELVIRDIRSLALEPQESEEAVERRCKRVKAKLQLIRHTAATGCMY